MPKLKGRDKPLPFNFFPPNIFICMKDNYKELNKMSAPRQHDRHNRLEKRINDISKVIKDPDPWGVNISSRDRVDDLEKRIDEIERQIDKLNGRIDGLNYLIKQVIK